MQISWQTQVMTVDNHLATSYDVDDDDDDDGDGDEPSRR